MAQTYYGNVIYTDGASHDWFGAKIVMRDEPIAGQNASTIYWDYYVWMTKASLTPYKYKYGNGVNFVLDGKTIVNTSNYGTHDPTGHVGEANALLYASGSTTVQHNEDGTKVFIFTFTYDQTQTSTLDKVVVQGTYMCAPIIRSSSISVDSGILGSEQRIFISRLKSTHTDTVRYSINNGLQEGTIADKTSETVLNWAPSLDIAALDISADTFGCTYTIETYEGNTLIGTSSKTVTLTMPNSASVVVPSGAISIVAQNPMPALAGVTDIIATKSYAQVRLLGDIKGDEYGATVKSVAITYNGSTQTANSVPANIYLMSISTPGTNFVSYTITNSRGRSVTNVIPFEVLPYNPPFIAGILANRCNVNGTKMPNGSYILIEGTPSFQNYGTNTAKVTYSLQLTDDNVATVAEQTITLPAIVGGGSVSPKNTYLLTVTVTDLLMGSQTYVINVPDESIPIYIKPNGKAMGLGAYALDDGTLNVGYTILKDGVPFVGGASIKAGTVTIGSTTSTCYYMKTESSALVLISTGYLMAAGDKFITLPTELQGFTSGAQGPGVVWATGNFSANVMLVPNATKNSVDIISSGMMSISIGLGNMLAGYFVLNYT